MTIDWTSTRARRISEAWLFGVMLLHLVLVVAGVMDGAWIRAALSLGVIAVVLWVQWAIARNRRDREAFMEQFRRDVGEL